MRRFLLAAAMVIVLLAGAGCEGSGGRTPGAAQKDSTTLAGRATRLAAALANADSAAGQDEPIARWILPPELAEISGLALTPDGRLFAHNDESARITELDYRRGAIIKQFYVGEEGLPGDFEGLAYAEDRFWLLLSTGTLWEFPEGAAEERVEYTEHDSGLGKDCEFESVAYDSTANALILACKTVKTKKSRHMLVLYRFDLGESGLAEPAEFTIPYADAIGGNDWKQLRPTDITVDPTSGNYVLVAAQEKALVALTPSGDVAISRPLGGRHPQAEGIAITRDGILIIGDESVSAPATITLYRWP
jgi:uncharacterized protein YjiK